MTTPPNPAGLRLSSAWVAILFTVILQAVAFIAWAAKVDSRVTTIETAITPLTDGTVARLDERTKNIQSGVERLERLATNGRP